ncbi:insulinase family protein, partial [Pseudomonadota bacterium]
MVASHIRQGRNPLLGLFFALLFVGCASVTPPAGQPVKSANDDYQYRLLTLPNEMQVLLVSAPNTSKAAASLDVEVGSGDNPPGRAGLAHFLEHMLFLGTDKYPDPAEYERYITEHGGTRNAYTSFENTNYFFDVNAPYLPEALDRFAQFFIAPRFDADYVDREKNAVEAEYQMGLKSDPRRGLDVVQEIMNPQHPYSQFSVGSLETLADRPDSMVRDELVQFYETYYSANMMRLVVLGPESLDELESLVVPLFSAVPNRDFQAKQIAAPIFEPGDLPMLVQVQPQATLRQLDLSFPIADYRAEYRVKPVSYLSNLVGHEGDGSLLSQLKAEGLAESLAAGTGLTWPGGGLFSVSISLTEKGREQYSRVVELFFSYMKMLRREGAQQWLYEEQARLAALGFRFKERVEPMSYVSAIASGMHDYAPLDILRGPYIMDRYDEIMLNGLLEHIRVDNALVILTADDAETDKASHFYQVPYSQRPVTGPQLARWQAASGEKSLHLPPANEFIAEDVALVPIAGNNPAVPDVALRRDRQVIWFKQDEQFRIPKGATYINFRSPEVGQSVQQSAAAVLYTSLLTDSVNEFAYPALLAGLNFDFYKQALLLEELLAAITEASFESQRFDDIRADMIRALQNRVAERPSGQVMQDMREALLYGEWGEDALVAELEQLELDDLQAYASRFWASARAEVMIYGNYQPDFAQQVSGMLEEVIPASDAPPLPELAVLKLAAGEELLYSVEVPHDDSVVAWYLQGEANEWQDRAATALTAQIMKSGFFQQLRTEQQLGYVVAAFSWPQLEVPGLVMLVQSPVADAPAVDQAMRTFVQALPADLDEAQFARHKAALISDILKPDKNLWERAEFYWQSIAIKQFDFNSRQALAEAVEAFTLDSWKGYYSRVFLEQPHSLQVVAP